MSYLAHRLVTPFKEPGHKKRPLGSILTPKASSWSYMAQNAAGSAGPPTEYCSMYGQEGSTEVDLPIGFCETGVPDFPRSIRAIGSIVF